MSAINTLTNTLVAHRNTVDVLSANFARSETNEPRENPNLILQTYGGQVSGLKLIGTTSTFDENLAADMRSRNAELETLRLKADLAEQLERQLLGKPGETASFFHSLHNMANAMKTLESDGISYSSAITAIEQWQRDMVAGSRLIQEERRQTDLNIGTDVNRANQLLADIAAANSRLANASGAERTTIINDRRNNLHELSALMEITTVNSTQNEQIDVFTKSQLQLVVGSRAGIFSHTPAPSPQATTVYNPILFRGFGGSDPIDVTEHLNQGEGRLQGSTTLRDDVLPAIQEQLDTIASHTVYSFNELHNQGTSLQARNTMLGEALPGGTAVSGAVAITGSGTIRIGVLDQSTGLVNTHADINLGNVTSIQDIVNAINGAGPSVQASIVNDVLQIKASNPNQGVVIGHAESDASQPTISFTNGTPHTRGFCHFFGLNNLFQYANHTAPVGFAQSISVRTDLSKNQGNSLSIAYAKHPTDPTPWKVSNRNTTLLRDMIDVVQTKTLNFPATAEASASQTTIDKYALSFIERHINSFASTRERTERTENILKGLSETAHKKSGVDPQKEWMELQRKTSDVTLIQRCLSITLKMQDELFKLEA